MLGTGARYAEYGITGGFFLLTQGLILGFDPGVLTSGARSLGDLLTASVDKIPNDARLAIQSLLVALALLSVFIIGLVLEIIGSVFVVSEARLFRKRLAMNQWIAKFVQAELPDYAEDYRLVLDVPNVWSVSRRDVLRVLESARDTAIHIRHQHTTINGHPRNRPVLSQEGIRISATRTPRAAGRRPETGTDSRRSQKVILNFPIDAGWNL
jgi:hypothetical protein